jgi:parallel beta-helix repeat protein
MRTPTLLLFVLALSGVVSVSGLARVAVAAEKTPPLKQSWYVSPTGADDNPGTAEKPFRTVQQAQIAMHAAKKKDQADKTASAYDVILQEGTYFLPQPLEFTPEDSGTADHPVTFRAADKKPVILSGGRVITGWQHTTAAGKKLWVADIPEVKSGKWYFHQLWVNGQRHYRARHPNSGHLKIAGLPDVTPKTPRYPGQKRFQFAPGDIKNWDNLKDVDVVALHLWVAVRMAVESVDEKERMVNFVKNSLRTLKDGPNFARFYVENAFELLDAPGEWYLNRHIGKLYYWPMPGEDMSNAEVIAPVLPHLVKFNGRADKKESIEHLHLTGLTFAHAEYWPARNDTVDVQAAASVPAVIQGKGLKHCRLTDCTIAHASNYGIHLEEGCQHNTIDGCHLHDLGAGGIRIGETTQRENPLQQTHTNLIAGNTIHTSGLLFHQAVGVWIGQSYDNRVSNNHIYDLYYTGISCGWTWGYGPTLARGNIIEGNHVHDIGKDLLSDMGGIYTLGAQPGTVIRNNIFHDISAYHYGGWGIYFDEGSTNIVAEKNLVYNTKHGGFHQHYGKDNIVRNNIFAFGKLAQIRRTRIEPHTSFTFERNIVFWKEGNLLDGNWGELKAAFDRNLYWKVGGGDFKFAAWNWQQWQAKGMDRESRIADPLFVDAEKQRFDLRENSPAFGMGFERFSVPKLAGQ